MLLDDFTADVNRLPLVVGNVHFILKVDSHGEISVLNEYFDVGKEYTGEYVWATIETMKQTLMVYYKDEKMMVREIKKFSYEIDENVHNFDDSIFTGT